MNVDVVGAALRLGILDTSDLVCSWCGCSQDSACRPRCWWVEVDLEAGTGTCSTCAGIAEMV